MQSWNIKTWSEGTWLGMRRRRRCLRWALSRPKATWAGHGKGEGSGRFLSPAPCRKLSPWGWREWCAAVCTVEMMTTGLRNRPRRWPRCPKPKNTKQGKRWISFHYLSRISQLHWAEGRFLLCRCYHLFKYSTVSLNKPTELWITLLVKSNNAKMTEKHSESADLRQVLHTVTSAQEHAGSCRGSRCCNLLSSFNGSHWNS